MQGVPTDAGIDFLARWYKPANGECRTLPPIRLAPSYLDSPRISCDPRNFGDSLCGGARELWLSLLWPRLIELGCKQLIANRGMGFNVTFEISNKSFPLLIIGWPERDAKNVSRAGKLIGTAAMRINPQIKQIYRAANSDAAFANKWMKRFYARGWRGRLSNGMRERWGVTQITDEELQSKVQGIMEYEPDTDTRDHTGRQGDRESVDGLLMDYAEMLSELRGAPSLMPSTGSKSVQ